MTVIRFYKPYGVLSQFRDPQRATLGDFIAVPDVYPAGRLDRDSEGLLLLTDDGALQARIAHPRFKLPKTYWAQVEAQPNPSALVDLAQRLHDGVMLKDGPARAETLVAIPDPELAPRNPPVTPHRAGRSSWVEVVLTAGRNRQVRRMLAAVGLPVLRLHRARVGQVDLEGLRPGQWEKITIPPALLWERDPARSHKTSGAAFKNRRRRRSNR